MLYYERKLKRSGFDFIIGVDEAGRGPLAGPVVAAAVYLKKKNFKHRIDDSKKLTSLQRENAYEEILPNSIYGLGIVSEKIIDKEGILPATIQAMECAIKELLKKIPAKNEAPLSKANGSLNRFKAKSRPSRGNVEKRWDKKHIHIIVDGNMNLKSKYPILSIIRGDSKSLSIASASIIAKVTRDRIMLEYHKIYPAYNFLEHKGYPTQKHVEAIKKFGPSAIHRLSFSYA